MCLGSLRFNHWWCFLGDSHRIVDKYDEETEQDQAVNPRQRRVGFPIYQMIAGLDFAPMLHDYGFALAGVAQYALYLLNRLYVADSPIANLIPLAAYVITETASQDGKVGGPVQITTVKPTVGCMQLSPPELGQVVAENRTRSEALRDSFFSAKSSP